MGEGLLTWIYDTFGPVVALAVIPLGVWGWLNWRALKNSEDGAYKRRHDILAQDSFYSSYLS